MKKLAVLVAGLAFVAACSNAGSVTVIPANQPTSPPPSTTASGATTGAAPTSAAPTSSASSTAPVTYKAPALNWTACGGAGFQCATLTVPVDYSKPDGPKLQLAARRLPASSPSQRIGPLFVNPGGPGGSAVEFLEGSAAVFPSSIRSRFDLVTFDPRGVNLSSGVRCESNTQLDGYFNIDPDPATPALRSAYDSANATFRAGCGPKDLLAHVGTADVARDIAVFRVALGAKQLTYFGFSYGTYLGTVLLAIDPTGVRLAVLDGAVDPKLDLVGFVSGQGQAFENALNRWFAWCTTANSCAFAAGSTAANQAKWDALDASSATAPLASGGRKLSTAEFLTATAYPLYSKSLWPSLGTALQNAQNGDGGAMLSLADSYNARSTNGTYEDSYDANVVINCLDHTGPATTDGYYAAAQAIRKTAPRLGPDIVYQQSVCAGWPIPANPPPITEGAGAPPVVVVGTTNDPATPYAWAQNLAHDLPTAVLLTHDGDGHTAYGPEAPCIQNIVDQAMLTAKAPAAGQTC